MPATKRPLLPNTPGQTALFCALNVMLVVNVLVLMMIASGDLSLPALAQARADDKVDQAQEDDVVVPASFEHESEAAYRFAETRASVESAEQATQPKPLSEPKPPAVPEPDPASEPVTPTAFEPVAEHEPTREREPAPEPVDQQRDEPVTFFGIPVE